MATLPNIKPYQPLFVQIQIVFVIVSLLFSNSLFSDDTNIEYKVKAGYLYNFTKFIYWTEKDSSTFNLCIMGTDPFGDLIKPIEQKTVLGKLIRLFRYPQLNDSFQHCNMIYFSASLGVKFLQNKTFNGILTVGEHERFVRHGGMLSFVTKENRIKLQINVKAIKKNGLGVNGKLVEVAEIIEANNE